MSGAEAGLGLAYRIHDFGAFHHFAEHAVAVVLHIGRNMVEEPVVFRVDEKLCGGGMRVGSARHGDGVGVVAQAVRRLILNRRIDFLLLHAGLKAAALDHEIGNHAMKNGAVVKAAVHIFQKIFHGIRGFFGIQLQRDGAVIGV